MFKERNLFLCMREVASNVGGILPTRHLLVQSQQRKHLVKSVQKYQQQKNRTTPMISLYWVYY